MKLLFKILIAIVGGILLFELLYFTNGTKLFKGSREYMVYVFSILAALVYFGVSHVFRSRK